MTTCFTLVTNMVTGLIIWEDWRTISMWIAYFAVHASMLLGVCLLAPADFLQQYRNTKLVEVRVPFSAATLEACPVAQLPCPTELASECEAAQAHAPALDITQVSKEIYREGTLRNLPAIELRKSASGELRCVAEPASPTPPPKPAPPSPILPAAFRPRLLSPTKVSHHVIFWLRARP